MHRETRRGCHRDHTAQWLHHPDAGNGGRSGEGVLPHAGICSLRSGIAREEAGETGADGPISTIDLDQLLGRRVRVKEKDSA